MSLSKHLNELERRIRELERWKEDVEQAIAEEEAAAAAADDPDPGVSLDGDPNGADRDQSQSLG